MWKLQHLIKLLLKTLKTEDFIKRKKDEEKNTKTWPNSIGGSGNRNSNNIN